MKLVIDPTEENWLAETRGTSSAFVKGQAIVLDMDDLCKRAGMHKEPKTVKIRGKEVETTRWVKDKLGDEEGTTDANRDAYVASQREEGKNRLLRDMEKSAKGKDPATLKEIVLMAERIPARHTGQVNKIQLMNDVQFREARASVEIIDESCVAFCNLSLGDIALGPDVGKDTIIHEVGHMVWDTQRKELLHHIRPIFNRCRETGRGWPSKYASTNESEFFCEAFRAHLSTPDWQKKRNPELYDKMREIIHG